jgi:ubiquinone/menaquinone biosynthesis C-methylase UbiE
MMSKRTPLLEEPMSGSGTVNRYDYYTRRYMMPEYRYFVNKIINRRIRSGRVLDIGTGAGRLVIELGKARKTDFYIIGVDVSLDMLRKARENVREAGLERRIDLVLSTGAELPFPDQCFDLVISYASLHHWAQPVAVFNEARRVAKDGGTIIIRDNRRVIGDPVWGTLARLVSFSIERSQRDLWPRSMRASYTVPEVRAILAKSNMKNAEVGADFVKLDLCITDHA